MSQPRSDASPTPTPTKHRGGFIQALSSLSKPVEEWGVSNVPVLSTSVTPRRERALAARSRQDSNNSKDTTPLPHRLDGINVFESPFRVPAIRPSSIATVSTFGGWMQERINEGNSIALQNSGTLTQRLWGSTYNQHTQPITPSRQQTMIESAPFSPAESCSPVRDINIHPLRMHPPSPSPSLAGRYRARQNQNTPQLTSLGKIPLPSTPSFDDTDSKASRETISTRHSRRTLPELNIKVANSNIRLDDEKLNRKDGKQAGVTKIDASPADKYPFPQDVGYVEAMRLWYEEKENEASGMRQRERKAARGAGRAECALASINANQRL